MSYFTPWLLYPQERTLLPTEEEAGSSPQLVWRALENRKSLAPARTQTPKVQPVAGCYTYYTTAKWNKNEQIMNWKGWRRKHVLLKFSYYLCVCQRRPEKTVRIVNVPFEVWTGYLMNTSQNIAAWTNLLSHNFLLFNMYYHKQIHGSTIINSSTDPDIAIQFKLLSH